MERVKFVGSESRVWNRQVVERFGISVVGLKEGYATVDIASKFSTGNVHSRGDWRVGSSFCCPKHFQLVDGKNKRKCCSVFINTYGGEPKKTAGFQKNVVRLLLGSEKDHSTFHESQNNRICFVICVNKAEVDKRMFLLEEWIKSIENVRKGLSKEAFFAVLVFDRENRTKFVLKGNEGSLQKLERGFQKNIFAKEQVKFGDITIKTNNLGMFSSSKLNCRPAKIYFQRIVTSQTSNEIKILGEGKRLKIPNFDYFEINFSKSIEEYNLVLKDVLRKMNST